jgi:hypothetical protein
MPSIMEYSEMQAGPLRRCGGRFGGRIESSVCHPGWIPIEVEVRTGQHIEQVCKPN